MNKILRTTTVIMGLVSSLVNPIHSQNIFPANGSVGIGTTIPSPTGVGLHIHRQAIIGTETFLHATVSDDNNSFLRLMNISGGNNEHIPSLMGQGVGRQALHLLGNITGDRDVNEPQNPIMVFNVRKDWINNISIGSNIVNRPLFSWMNSGLPLMQMAANGNLSVGTSANPDGASLFLFRKENPSLRIQSTSDQAASGNVLEMAVSTCAGCYGVPNGAAVIRQLAATNGGSGNLILNIPSNGDHKRSVRISDLNGTNNYLLTASHTGVMIGRHLEGDLPSAQLHTIGSVRFQGLAQNNTFSQVVVRDVSGNLAWRDVATLGSNNSTGWALNGNSTTQGQFIGTTNNEPLVLKVNNQQAGYLGMYNTFLGEAAGLNSGIQTFNTAIGYAALTSNTSGFENTSIGNASMRINTKGQGNTSTGSQSLESNTIGSDNSAYGYRAGIGNESGEGNTYIGAASGTTKPDIKFATAIGRRATVSVDNGLVLGKNSDVLVGIGTSSPNQMLHIVNDPTNNRLIKFENLPTGSGHILVVDANGIIRKSNQTAFVGNTEQASLIKSQQVTIDAQKAKIETLEERLNRLESALNNLLKTPNDQSLKSRVDFKLEQNTPNPFSDKTRIAYELPQNVGVAQIVITDLIGRQVKTIPLENCCGEIELSTQDFSNGTFMYSLIINGKILKTNKMVISKN